MTIDWTINISDVAILGAGIIAFVKVSMSLRDTLRDVVRRIGTEEPPSGLLGDVHHIKKEQQQHREWLIRGGMDRHV